MAVMATMAVVLVDMVMINRATPASTAATLSSDTTLISHPSLAVSAPALITTANILSGNDIQTQFLIDRGVLGSLHHVLNSNHGSINHASIKAIACQAISNITVENTIQIQAVIDSNLVASLIYLIRNGGFDIKREATTAIANATYKCSGDQIRFLVDQGCIKALCGLLACRDQEMIKNCLVGLENILKVGEEDRQMRKLGVNPYAAMVEQCGALDIMAGMDIYESTSSGIYDIAVDMLRQYWHRNPEKRTCGYDLCISIGQNKE
ncbi:hypothetical protein Dimus_012055 [Dionaea muscipula]